jgi:hypothetical protein
MPLSKIKANSLTSPIDLTSPVISSPTISGNTNFDSGTLFVDSVNNRVGVGITNPGYTLSVAGDFNSQLLRTRTSYTDSFQNIGRYYQGLGVSSSINVPTNNAWTTVFTLGNGQTAASSSTGAVVGFSDDSTSGFIQISKDWGNAYLIGWVAFTSKSAFDFNHLSILSSYGYNTAIQISGASIQVRHTGNRAEPVNISVHAFG